MTKICKGCGQEKPADHFYRSRNSDGRAGKCKQCTRGEASARYHANPEIRERKRQREKERQAESPRVITPEQALSQRLWSHYRIRPERYYAMLEQQGGRCAICKDSEPGGMGRWHVDHDHACCAGKKSCGNCVRSLLCSRCNVGLGMFMDDPDRLRAALNYLTDAAMKALGAIA